MNRSTVLTSLWNYRSCFVPPLAILAGFALLVVLAIVVGKFDLDSVELKAIAEFPRKLTIPQLQAVVGVGLWWLFSVYLFWLVAIVGSVACLYVVRSTASNKPPAFRRAALGVVGAVTVLFVAALTTFVWTGGTLMSMQNVIAPIGKLAQGLRRLMELTNGLAIVSVVLVVVCAGVSLAPAKSQDAVKHQMEQLNVLLYVSAAIVVAWVFQSRLLYGFAATALIDEQSKYVGGVAPTVSLVVGAVGSIYLILTYLLSVFVLHRRFSNLGGAAVKASRADERPKQEGSPMTLPFPAWSRTIALLVPVLPGTFEFFFNFVDKFTKG